LSQNHLLLGVVNKDCCCRCSCYCSFIYLFGWGKNLLLRYSFYVKFVGHNLTVMHCHYVIIDLTMFRTEFVSMVMICLQSKFHMPSSYGSLVTTIKLKTKYKLCHVVVLHSIKEIS